MSAWTEPRNSQVLRLVRMFRLMRLLKLVPPWDVAGGITTCYKRWRKERPNHVMNVSEVRRIQQFDHLLLGAQDATGCHRMPQVKMLSPNGSNKASLYLALLPISLSWPCSAAVIIWKFWKFNCWFGSVWVGCFQKRSNSSPRDLDCATKCTWIIAVFSAHCKTQQYAGLENPT